MVGYIIKIENPPTSAGEKTDMLIGFSGVITQRVFLAKPTTLNPMSISVFFTCTEDSQF